MDRTWLQHPRRIKAWQSWGQLKGFLEDLGRLAPVARIVLLLFWAQHISVSHLSPIITTSTPAKVSQRSKSSRQSPDSHACQRGELHLQSFPKNLRRIFEREAIGLVFVHELSQCLLWVSCQPLSRLSILLLGVLTFAQAF